MANYSTTSTSYSNATGGAISVMDWETILISVSLALMIAFMIFGNILVITAIIVDRDLQRSQYYLILSLAVADLLVGVAVSPLAAIYEIHKQWHLGYIMCDLWTCLDVLVCTASILHLVAIALDRYWSITDVAYTQKRTPRRIGTMIALVWLVSLVISIAPLLGMKDDKFEIRVANKHCMISQSIIYQIISTMTAFYIPLVLICVLYYKIFKAAQHRIRLQEQRRSSVGLSVNNRVAVLRKSNVFVKVKSEPRLQKISLPASSFRPVVESTSSDPTELNRRRSADELANYRIVDNSPMDSPLGTPKVSNSLLGCSSSTPLIMPKVSVSFSERGSMVLSSVVSDPNGRKYATAARKRESMESKRERRAGRTLAIITSLFILCWVPFFILALYRPVCSAYLGQPCPVPQALESLLGWLGYMNSALNPILYTIFSPDFRSAFKKIVRKLCTSFLYGFSFNVRQNGGYT